MLVISRKRDEFVRFTVPPSTTPTVVDVMIVDIRGDKVRTGIHAPREVHILRSELLRHGNDAETAKDGGPDLEQGE